MNLFIAHIQNGQALLTEEESFHCVKVLRHKAGDLIHFIDGEGGLYSGIIAEAHPKHCVVTVSDYQQQSKHPYYLHIAIAPTKQIDRIEWFVEKAVEIGIDEISFLRCKNSERTVVKTDRIRKITESAAKQSLSAFLPKINELEDFKTLIDRNTAATRLIAHCSEQEKTQLSSFKGQEDCLVLIGPEGDFSPDEIEAALQKGFRAVSLGEKRLRTETAGLFACACFAI